jgi:hypothetical protein
MSRPALEPTQRHIHAEGLKIMCVQTIFKDTDNKKLCSLIFTILERGATIKNAFLLRAYFMLIYKA